MPSRLKIPLNSHFIILLTPVASQLRGGMVYFITASAVSEDICPVVQKRACVRGWHILCMIVPEAMHTESNTASDPKNSRQYTPTVRSILAVTYPKNAPKTIFASTINSCQFVGLAVTYITTSFLGSSAGIVGWSLC